MEQIISFPHLGDYCLPFKIFLERTTNIKVQVASPITNKTLEIGNKYAPLNICIPFKYNLGNFIESLENGANILFTAGGGCKYRYYAEVTKTILKDLGYDFLFLNFMDKGKINLKKNYMLLKKLNGKLTWRKYLLNLLYLVNFIWNMDKIDKIIRKNIGFEINKNEHVNLKKKMLTDFSKTKSIMKLNYLYYKYKHLFNKIPLNKPRNCLKVGLIGELYTEMEQKANYDLEKTLANYKIEVTRYTNLSYLLWQKKFLRRHILFKTRKYCKYELGADGLDNVYRTIIYTKRHYDGIIHTKPFGCTPEIGAIPIIQKICSEENMPIIFFSYDAQTSSEGIKTRLEAFFDLLEMRKDKNDKRLFRN